MSAAIFLIVVGGIIFIVSFFGCFGAIKENRCMLITVRTSLKHRDAKTALVKPH